MSIHPRFEDTRQFREAAVTILRNWRDELTVLSGQLLQSGFWRGIDPVIVEIRDNRISVSRISGQTISDLGNVPPEALTEPGSAASILASLAIANGVKNICLQLPPEEVLRTRIRLPLASANTLRKALRYELARLSPLDPSQLYFDFEIADKDKKSNKVEIALRIIKRDVVDSAVATCHTAGLSIGAIGFTGDVRPADWMHFPVDRNAFAFLQWQRWSIPFLGGFACLLIVATLAAAYSRGAAVLDDLNTQLAMEGRRAAAVAHLKHDIAAADAQAAFAARQKQAPLFVAILSDTTRFLPDGTWLTNFQVIGRKVHIQGYSSAASNLVGLIDRSKVFANAQFEAPLVRDPSQKADRFDLSFQIAGHAP